MKKASPKVYFRHFWIVGALFIFALLVYGVVMRDTGASSHPFSPWFGTVQISGHEEGHPPSNAQVAKCEKLMQITLPSTATPTNYLYKPGLDDSAYLRFDLPAHDLAKFIQSSPFSGHQLSRSEIAMPLLDEISWWEVEGATEFESGTVWLSGSGPQFISILIDKKSKDVVHVYLKWSDT